MADARDWSVVVRDVLTQAGWKPGRAIPEGKLRDWNEQLAASRFPTFEAAERILREFGGIAVDLQGLGLECAQTPFEIDPTLAIGEDDRFAGYEPTIGARIAPLGEVGNGHAFLGVSESGRVLIVGDYLLVDVGATIYDAIAAFIEGRKGRQLT
jgi:hypothetical protein